MTTPFIDRDDLGARIGRDLSDDDGAQIAVDSACAIVRTITEQDFNQNAADLVRLDGTGTDTVLLPQLPVSEVTGVSVNGAALTTDDFTFTEQGHLIRTAGTATWTSWSSNGCPPAYWPEGRQNVEVTYKHGYSVSSSRSDVPADVRSVALAIASRLITQGDALSETIGQSTQRYAVASSELSENELRILRKYKAPQ